MRLLALLALAWALGVGPAGAHAQLVGADPAAGAVVATAPETIVLTFTEPVSPLVFRWLGPDGSVRDLEVRSENTRVIVPGAAGRRGIAALELARRLRRRPPGRRRLLLRDRRSVRRARRRGGSADRRGRGGGAGPPQPPHHGRGRRSALHRAGRSRGARPGLDPFARPHRRARRGARGRRSRSPRTGSTCSAASARRWRRSSPTASRAPSPGPPRWPSSPVSSPRRDEAGRSRWPGRPRRCPSPSPAMPPRRRRAG